MLFLSDFCKSSYRVVSSVSGDNVVVYRCAEIKIERLMGTVSQSQLQEIKVICKHRYYLDVLNEWSE